MDPVTVAIIAAISAGSTSGVADATKKAIVDGYEGLKALLKKKFGTNSDAAEAIEKLQANPESPGRRETLAEELKMVNAAGEPELLNAAQALLKLIKDLPQGEQHIQVAYGTSIAQADRGSTATVNMFGPLTGKKDD
jgi:hypothetical protein